MAVRVLIEGKVQGVWFRGSTQKEAERVGAKGWVRNLPDGRVEGHFEGPPDAVDALVAWVHKGPENAEVGKVVIDAMAADEGCETFRVLR